ncbi:lysophospholipase [Patiriisocius marinistellae]|uniref:Lysophospholipase n=1 Tax=Patiriisocius marinistellae TaxID=2494560 RepID=A0A5J4FRW8_9FLAO|nr:SGNH/GDSL hydrolase family protein [Patiriisocius marinistellae]GEQ84557.1 lysophospholipase [Patiriisocius marinistellae]
MQIIKSLTILVLSIFLITGCSSIKFKNKDLNDKSQNFKYLALGDSYTKGESVCSTCGFPIIITKAIELKLQQPVSLKQIAQTGWTTTQLLDAISKEEIKQDYNLVTLLIGVNNQFQGKPFSLFETEFLSLINSAIKYANGDASKVIILSIPDYGHTPYGSGKMKEISKEIDIYNNYIKTAAASKNIEYINITDITRKGLLNPELVASDGLHPSKEVYKLVAKKLLKQLKY